MSNVKINNEINLTYPDGFNEMSEEELIRFFNSSENRWGVFNPEKHILISVNWKKAGFMKDTESLLIDIEARTRRSLLNYQRVSSYTVEISKKTAYAIRFEYRVDDARIVQVCDLLVFKYKNLFYALQFVSRKAGAEENRLILQDILKSISVG